MLSSLTNLYHPLQKQNTGGRSFLTYFYIKECGTMIDQTTEFRLFHNTLLQISITNHTSATHEFQTVSPLHSNRRTSVPRR